MIKSNEEHIDLNLIMSKLWAKRYYFAVSLLLAMIGAWCYMRLATPVYRIGTTIQLKAQGLSGNNKGSASFINGLELLSGDDELEDEIGILSSFSMVKSALGPLDYQVSYFRYNQLLDGFLNGFRPRFSSQFVSDSFKIEPSSSALQAVNVPVYISFPTDSTYRIKLRADDVNVYNWQNDKLYTKVDVIAIDEEVLRGEPFVSTYLNFTLYFSDSLDAQKESYYFILHDLNTLTKNFRSDLSVEPISAEANIVRVSTSGTLIEKKIRFLDGLCRTYIEQDQLLKDQLGYETIEFIDRQLSTVTDSLKKVESNLESFRAKSNIVDISTTSKSLVAQLDELERKKADLTVEDDYLKFLADLLGKTENVESIAIPSATVVDDPVLNNLLIELARLNREMVEVKYNSTANNPVLHIKLQEIEEIRVSIVNIIDNRINSTRLALRELNRQIRTIDKTINRLPQNERNLIDIERKFNFNDNIYNYLLEKRAEVGIATASNVPDKLIIDSAQLLSEKPVSPKGWLVYGLALLAGMAFPIGLIVVQEFRNDTIAEEKEILTLTDLPVIGSIANDARKSKLTSAKYPNSPTAESFRFLRVNLQYYYRETKNKIIAFTSSIDGEGKTFCSANLAVELARSGKETLLIAGDLRRPKLHEYFPSNHPGIVDYIVKRASISDIVRKTQIPNLSMVSSGSTVLNSFDFLESPEFKLLLTEARSRFDYVIVDTPPISFAVDYFMLQPFFDITMLVVRQNYTSKEVLEQSVETLQKSNPRHLTILFNNTKDTKAYNAYHDEKKGIYINRVK